LRAAQVDHIAMLQPQRLLADRCAIDQRRAFAFDVGDRIGVQAAVDDHHLHAGPAQRGQRLAQFHLLARVIAVQNGDPRQQRLGRGGGGQRTDAVGHELHVELGDLDDVVILQEMLADAVAVDKRAISAMQVFQEGIVEDGDDDGVLAADGRMAEHDIVVAMPAQRHALLAQLHLLFDRALARYDDLRQSIPPFFSLKL